MAYTSQFIHARTCYGHLAGETAVHLLERMVKARWLVRSGRDYAVTETGKARLGAIGVDVERARSKRRAFARGCLDLTQRRPHLAGALGDALLDVFFERGWIQRVPASRAVILTPSGKASLRQIFARRW